MANCATRFVTVIRVGRKDRTVPLGLAKKTEPCGSSHYPHGLKDRCVGNQAALVVKISVRLNMQRKVYSWDGARRCTICDNVIVRSARRRTEKNEWLPRGSLITLLRGASRLWRHKRIYLLTS